MFVTSNQFYVFTACFAFGGVGGILFSMVHLLRAKIYAVFMAIIDGIILTALGVLFVAFSVFMHFPNLAPYMIFGVFLGILAYMKSFHIILAKVCEKSYNVISKKLRKEKNDRRKSKKSKNSRKRRRGVVIDNSSYGLDISDDSDKFRTPLQCGIRCKNFLLSRNKRRRKQGA